MAKHFLKTKADIRKFWVRFFSYLVS